MTTTCACTDPRHRTACPRVTRLRRWEAQLAFVASRANDARISVQLARRALAAGDETQASVEESMASLRADEIARLMATDGEAPDEE
jgi:hypothetical protein